MADDPILLIDNPAPGVRRLTLNRPDKRNALSNALRGALFAALEEADKDPDVRVMVIRGAGKCFSSGYDLAGVGDLPGRFRTGQPAANHKQGDRRGSCSCVHADVHLCERRGKQRCAGHSALHLGSLADGPSDQSRAAAPA